MSESVDEGRWVKKRTQYLSSNNFALREKVAEAVAWSELGYSKSGIAERMDVAETTASKYLDTASEAYPGILLRSVVDIGGDPSAGVEDLPSDPGTECPVCLNDTLVGASAADTVFGTSGWGATNMLEDAELVCSTCHSVRISGEWRRMQKMHHRAYEIVDAGNKSFEEAKETISGGIDPGTTQVVKDRGTDDAEGW